ncbi:MAG TPA: chemotaxis protein CheW [Pyrinomonadaceae bacterium]|jgi:chemotaxis signal transduction protein
MNKVIREKPIGGKNRASIGFSDSPNSLYNDELFARTSGEKFVVFLLSEKLYGIPARQVAEVSQPLTIAALPNSPEWLLGIVNLRGEIIAIVSLPKLFGENIRASTAKTKLIVLKAKNYDTAIGFPVDKLSEIIAEHDKKFEAAGENDSPFIYAKFTYQSNTVHLIDSESLLSSLTTN